MSIFVDRQNGELCVVDREFFDIRTSYSTFFRYFDATRSITAIFFGGRLKGELSIFSGDRRRMHWRRCNVKLLNIFGVSNCNCNLFHIQINP